MRDGWAGGDGETNPVANNKIKKRGGTGEWRWRSKRRWLNNLYTSCYSFFLFHWRGPPYILHLFSLWTREASCCFHISGELVLWLLRYPSHPPNPTPGWCRTQSVVATVDRWLPLDSIICWQLRCPFHPSAVFVHSRSLRQQPRGQECCTESTFQKEHCCSLHSICGTYLPRGIG